MAMINLSHDNIDSLLSQHDFMVIDFGAKWCGPCQSFDKIYQQIADQYADIAFAKVDIEEHPDIAQEFNIRSVPTIAILRYRTLVFLESGAMSATTFADLIKQAREITKEQASKQ